MSADLQTFVSSSIGMLGSNYLGVGSDLSQRRFPKEDLTDGHVEVTKNDFLSLCIARDIFLQNLLQKDKTLPSLNCYLLGYI